MGAQIGHGWSFSNWAFSRSFFYFIYIFSSAYETKMVVKSYSLAPYNLCSVVIRHSDSFQHVFTFRFLSKNGEKIKVSRAKIAEKGRFYIMESWQQFKRGEGHEKISCTKAGRLHEVRTISWLKFSSFSMLNFNNKMLINHSRYNKLSREIRELANKIKELDSNSEFRTESSAQLLEKLYQMGLIPTRWDLALAINVSASSFCRRRLPVVMIRSEFYRSFYILLW